MTTELQVLSPLEVSQLYFRDTHDTFPETPKLRELCVVADQPYIYSYTSSGILTWIPLGQRVTSYTHTQLVENTTWVIEHNFGTDSVICISVNEFNQVVYPKATTNISAFVTQLEFTSPVKGMAIAFANQAMLTEVPMAGNVSRSGLITQTLENTPLSSTDFITYALPSEMAGQDPVIFLNGLIQTMGVNNDYVWSKESNTISFNTANTADSVVTVFYYQYIATAEVSKVVQSALMLGHVYSDNTTIQYTDTLLVDPNTKVIYKSGDVNKTVMPKLGAGLVYSNGVISIDANYVRSL